MHAYEAPELTHYGDFTQLTQSSTVPGTDVCPDGAPNTFGTECQLPLNREK